MGLLDDGLKKNVLLGLAVGLGTSVVAPFVVPILTVTARAFFKATIKSGLLLYEKGKEIAAEAAELVEDTVAEAKAELEEAGKK
jgi:hypothetical protein